MPLAATTLTLPCHKEQVTPVGSQDGLERMLEIACAGLNITREQLRQELEESGDILDLVSGALTAEALKQAPRTLALMRYPYLPASR
jgi:hypothetical protein